MCKEPRGIQLSKQGEVCKQAEALLRFPRELRLQGILPATPLNWRDKWIFVVQLLSCFWLCNSMDCSMPVSPILHCLLKFAQIYVHWVSDAIQSSHPLMPHSLFAFSLSQYQGLFQCISSWHQVAEVLIGASASALILPMNIKGWFPLG